MSKSLYETIFIRRAVRAYDKTELPQETLDEIKQFIAGTNSLPGAQNRFELVPASSVSDGKAPHYILAYALDENPVSIINIGYVLEKTDLFLQNRGLGSVWLGMPHPTVKELKPNFIIMMGFGPTNVPQRSNLGEFNRLSFSEISDQENEIAKAARLAPSAMNSQPWQLHFEDGKVVINYRGRGLMQLVLKGKMSKIDIGIITRIVEIILLNDNKTITSIHPVVGNGTFGTEISYQ